MSFRRIIFWAHLIVGVLVGLIVLLMSATGVVLTYERQIIAFAESRLPVSSGSQTPLPADALAAIARAEAGDEQQVRLVYRNQPDAPVTVLLGRRQKLFLDPYMGDVVHRGPVPAEGFLRSVEGVHRWLALSGGGRDAGRAITGASNLAFVFIIISGLYLWLPNTWRWSVVRARLLFRRNPPTARARDSNWHFVIGMWCLAPLFFISFSGVVISYPWASKLVVAAAGGNEAPASAEPDPALTPPARRLTTPLQTILEDAVTQGRWRTVSLTLPEDDGSLIEVSLDAGSGGQPSQRETLTYSPADARLLERSSIADAAPGRRARVFLRFLHTGEVFGLLGQTLAGLASLGACVLMYTGWALAYRRLIAPLFKARKQSA